MKESGLKQMGVMELRRRWSRRVHVRPTPLGWAYLGGVLGLTVAAFNTGNNLLYVVLALLLAILVLQSVLAELNLRGVRVSRQLPGEVFAFEAAHGALVVSMPTTRFPAFSLEIQEMGEGEARGAALAVPAQGTQAVPVSWTFSARGEVSLGALRVSSTFPFGLFRRYRELELPGTSLVYPRRGLRPTVRQSADKRGNHGSAGRAGGEGDFVGLRPYQPGDPVRTIHWPNSARGVGPLVVQRAIGHAEEVLIQVPGTPGRMEQELERACGEVVRHLARGHAVGLALPLRRIRPGQGLVHRRCLLAALATQPAESP